MEAKKIARIRTVDAGGFDAGGFDCMFGSQEPGSAAPLL